MNKVTLTGRLARDPEMRYTTTGKAVWRRKEDCDVCAYYTGGPCDYTEARQRIRGEDMARPKQCTSCLFFILQRDVPMNIFNRMSLMYDGWCKWYKEERDRDEKTCLRYKPMVERNKV
ncbi:single-stranded DNA-binding protein [Anaerovibrio lipolyticus]|uniref:single-stranded DNA-binding protein n=1 Tax=Anaerovibrio lipolyticus TaxID=82374 RepID=UPI0026F2A389|nr:single-stranded DNA-binding protein [Anaerovibrio lipolyticus]